MRSKKVKVYEVTLLNQIKIFFTSTSFADVEFRARKYIERTYTGLASEYIQSIKELGECLK